MITEETPHFTTKARPIPALTGLRAAAAYAVFLHHYNPAPPDTFANRLFAQGYIGVSIFFVLSGFLIQYRYAGEGLMSGAWLWRPYLQNRFARIFPLYALLLTGTTVVAVMMDRTMNWPLFGLNLTLLKGFFDQYTFSGIAQSWSLTVEACFYAMAPLLFVALRRWGALSLAAGLTGIGISIWAILHQMDITGGVTGGFFGSLPFVLFYTFFGRAFEFLLGMALARRWQQGRLPRFRFATVTGLVLVGTCVGWQAFVLTATTHANTLFWSEVGVYNYGLPIGIGILFAGLLRERTVLSRLLAQPIMQALGRSSYAFYLIHIGLLPRLLQKAGLADTAWLLFCLLIPIAHGLYAWVEKPLNRWFRSVY